MATWGSLPTFAADDAPTPLSDKDKLRYADAVTKLLIIRDQAVQAGCIVLANEERNAAGVLTTLEKELREASAAAADCRLDPLSKQWACPPPKPAKPSEETPQ